MKMEGLTCLVYIIAICKYLYHGPEHDKFPFVSLPKPMKRIGAQV